MDAFQKLMASCFLTAFFIFIGQIVYRVVCTYGIKGVFDYLFRASTIVGFLKIAGFLAFWAFIILLTFVFAYWLVGILDAFFRS